MSKDKMQQWEPLFSKHKAKTEMPDLSQLNKLNEFNRSRHIVFYWAFNALPWPFWNFLIPLISIYLGLMVVTTITVGEFIRNTHSWSINYPKYCFSSDNKTVNFVPERKK